MVVMASGRLRGRGFDSPMHWNFFSLLFFYLIFSPFIFLHARSAISMLKHFSSILYVLAFAVPLVTNVMDGGVIV